MADRCRGALRQDLALRTTETDDVLSTDGAGDAGAAAQRAKTETLRAGIASRTIDARRRLNDMAAAPAELHVMRKSRSWRFTGPPQASAPPCGRRPHLSAARRPCRLTTFVQRDGLVDEERSN